MGADGEQLGPLCTSSTSSLADMSDKLAVDEIGECDALRQIGAARRSLFLRHCRSPLRRQAVMLRNSWRSSGLSRKQPSMRLVTRSAVRLVDAARRSCSDATP